MNQEPLLYVQLIEIKNHEWAKKNHHFFLESLIIKGSIYTEHVFAFKNGRCRAVDWKMTQGLEMRFF